MEIMTNAETVSSWFLYNLKVVQLTENILYPASRTISSEDQFLPLLFLFLSRLVLLVTRIKNHLSNFELDFLNIFSRQNLLRSLSLVLFLLQRYRYGAKKCPKNCVRFDFSQSENRKTIQKPLKELPWNQQCR